MDDRLRDRIRGIAVGAAVGDALGMPLEFRPRRPAHQLVREMLGGRLPSGTFTDDTEMALAVAESLLAHLPLDPEDLGTRFLGWFRMMPTDVGVHTKAVLEIMDLGEDWEAASKEAQRINPDSAGNGSVMRCWPVAVVHRSDLERLLADSQLQSRVTHAHPECGASCAFVNAAIYWLLSGVEPAQAVAKAVEAVGDSLPSDLRLTIEDAPTLSREQLLNSGWVRHTVESAVWGLLTTSSFEEAVVQVVNLGDDTDTAGAVVGALAGAAYGLEAIPKRWRDALRGEWPPRGRVWREADLIVLADRLASRS
ncbi:MAG TPA: ADP-ribosylglycohydrolase family protein [Anaerolineae bacterium]|nr:ADP-ribosylglycohydrolase family protein [Anaerolineae bacterium]